MRKCSVEKQTFSVVYAATEKVKEGLKKEKAKFGEVDGVARTTLKKDDLLFGPSGNGV